MATQDWIVLSSSSGETFRKVWRGLSTQAHHSLKGAFVDRECGALAVFKESFHLREDVTIAHWSKDIFEHELLNWMEQTKFNGVVLLCGFFKIISLEFLEKCPALVVNTHPSLLPAFPGMDKKVHEKAAQSVPLSGFSVHAVTPELDGGPIFFQHPVFLDPQYSPEELRQQVRVAEQHWLPRVWDLILREKVSKGDSTLTTYELRRKYRQIASLRSFTERGTPGAH